MNIKSWILSIAILILTLFVVIYGMDLVYENPEYEDFCSSTPVKQINTSAECEANTNSKWISFNDEEDSGYCDVYYYCKEEYDSAREVYSRHVFLTSIILGILIILLGGFLFSAESVSVGLMAGGVGTFLFGIGSYWKYADTWLRFVVSFAGLVIVILITYYLNYPEKLRKKKKK
jgi:hypothetical protein